MLYEGIGKLAALGASDGWRAHRANEVEQSARDLGENTLGLEMLQRSWNSIRSGRGGPLDYLNLGLTAAPGAGRSVGSWALRRLARNLEGTGAKDMGRALLRSRLPEGATPKGAPDPVAPGMTPREAAVPPEPVHPGSPYTAKQEGPYRVVRRQGARPQTSPEARGASLDAQRALLADPAKNEPARIASAYTQENFGRPYDATFEKPKSSLRKQSGIGRSYQMAVEGDPDYKRAVFERYGQTMPEVVERTGAQNYDQLTEAAYKQLVDETTRQFQTLPVEMRYHYGEGEYPVPSAMLSDVLGEGKLNVFRGGDPHPYLSAVDEDTGLTANEMFRAVHDYFGHGTRGSTFRPGGEEIAYASHAQMMSPLARAALASETRGQNSLVNYSPLNAKLYYEMNKVRDQIAEERVMAAMRGQKADPNILAPLNAQLREMGTQTQFAPQIPLLLPPEMLDPAFKGGLPDYIQALSRPRFAAPSERAVHLSTTPGLTATDPAFYGTGHRGDDWAERSARIAAGAPADHTSFYLGPQGTVMPESMVAAVAPHAYETKLSGLYDIHDDPEQLVQLARSYNLEAARKGTRGAYLPDFARLVREYGYSGYKNPHFTGNQGAANVFDPVGDLKPIERGEKGYAEGGPVASLPVPGAVALPLPEAT